MGDNKRIIKRIKRKSQKQESAVAQDFGGRVLPGSGAIDGMKGDARTSNRSAGTFSDADYLIENKFTESDGYILNVRTWEKIRDEARRDGMRIPLMQIDIEPSPYEKHRIVVQEIDEDFAHLPLGMYVEARRSKKLTPYEVPADHERTLLYFTDRFPLEIVTYAAFLRVKSPGDAPVPDTPPAEPEDGGTSREDLLRDFW